MQASASFWPCLIPSDSFCVFLESFLFLRQASASCSPTATRNCSTTSCATSSSSSTRFIRSTRSPPSSGSRFLLGSASPRRFESPHTLLLRPPTCPLMCPIRGSATAAQFPFQLEVWSAVFGSLALMLIQVIATDDDAHRLPLALLLTLIAARYCSLSPLTATHRGALVLSCSCPASVFYGRQDEERLGDAGLGAR